MGKPKTIALGVMLGLVLSSTQIYANESLSKNPTNIEELPQKIEKNIDIEEFKEEFKKVSSSNTIIKGQVNTLKNRYLLSPGDNITMSVYGEPEFSQAEIIVAPDGYATIEPFGELKLAGLSISDLTEVLTGKFRNYLLDPKISIKMNNFKTAKVYVHGAVNRAGLYEQGRETMVDDSRGRTFSTVTPITVASAIANSGGVKHNADIRNIQVTNHQTGKTYQVNLFDLIKSGDVNQDIYLSSGDSIYIPYLETEAQMPDDEYRLIASSSLAPTTFPVRIVGEVTSPGVYDIDAKNPGVNSLLAASEGFNEFANRDIVKIDRMTAQGNISTIFVDPNQGDFTLYPNDLITVKPKKTTTFGRKFSFFGVVSTPVRAVSDAYNGVAEMFDPTRRYDWR
ncbi:MAG: polysaccharide export protein [Candidatus Gastranaerophilales bacterium]|nr:polysaccharide export protein [Candidatus Gastranaerophilales bacterium]